MGIGIPRLLTLRRIVWRLGSSVRQGRLTVFLVQGGWNIGTMGFLLGHPSDIMSPTVGIRGSVGIGRF